MKRTPAPSGATAQRHHGWTLVERSADPRTSRFFAVLTVCIAAAAAVSLVVQLVDHGKRTAAATTHPRTRQSIATVPASTRTLVSWVRTAVPASTPVITDQEAAALLRAAGYRGATNDLTGCRAGTLILVTEALHRDASLQSCISRSYPIATLNAAQVREIPADLAAALRARADARANQKRGGVALAQNPSLSATASARAALLSGRVDLRVESVLAELSAHFPVRLLAIDDVAAERAAGMPARTVQIDVADPANVDPLLQQVVAAYRPDHVVRTSSHTLRLTWPFRTQPPPVLD